MLSLLLMTLAVAASEPDCSLQAGSLPNPALPAGQRNPASPLRHIVVIMQENHSFDNYLGALNESRFYGAEVDGVSTERFNLDRNGKPVYAHPEPSLCVADVAHSWNAMHSNYGGGRMDGFVLSNDQHGTGARAMGYFGPSDLPYYYALANQFAISDRYFSSVLTSTFPNRFFLMAGTAFGHIRNDTPQADTEFAQKTIYQLLTEHGVSWKYYSNGPGYLKLFKPAYLANLDRLSNMAGYEADLRNGTLPEVSFIDSNWEAGEDEHPSANVQMGQAWVAGLVDSLMKSTAWKDSALLLTYDEGGGFYDHVAPPEACAPDAIAPALLSTSLPGDYRRLGFRVPFFAVSPYAKRHHVSHTVLDHGSILKFIEIQHNLPALTARDANADGLTDLFDFGNPVFEVAPLPSGLPDPARVCSASDQSFL